MDELQQELEICALRGRIDELRKLVEDSPASLSELSDSVISHVIDTADLSVIEAMLDLGWSVDARCEQFGTPLLGSAAKSGRVDLVDLLIRRGANARAMDDNGDSVLLEACSRKSANNLKCIDLFLKAGVDPNIGHVYSPLMWSIESGTLEMVKRLVVAGADPNRWYRAGNALTSALASKNLRATSILLEAGADPNALIPDFADLLKKQRSATSIRELAKEMKLPKMLTLFEDTSAPQPSSQHILMGPVWKKIEGYVESTGRNHEDVFSPGADESAIKSLETQIGRRLPEDLRKSMKRHDGQPQDEAFFQYCEPAVEFLDDENSLFRLLPIKEIPEEIQRMTTIEKEMGTIVERYQAESGIAPSFYCKSWIPVATNSLGDLLCCDVAPPADGTLGQIVFLSSESPVRTRVANSWYEYLSQFADSHRRRYDTGHNTFRDATTFEIIEMPILTCFWWKDQNGVLSEVHSVVPVIEGQGTKYALECDEQVSRHRSRQFAALLTCMIARIQSGRL